MELVNLKSLMFNSYDDHAELVIEVRKEKLSYLSTYLIDVIEINKILNSIQRNNIELDLNDCIESVDYSDFQEFALDINKIENLSMTKSEIDFMAINSFKKQIRA